jgi:hypothetical protein
MKRTGIELIAQERQEQIELHGRTLKQDSKLNKGKQLVIAAIAIAHPKAPVIGYCAPDNWDEKHFRRMKNKSYKKRLIIAGALIAAELDRINKVL